MLYAISIKEFFNQKRLYLWKHIDIVENDTIHVELFSELESCIHNSTLVKQPISVLKYANLRCVS